MHVRNVLIIAPPYVPLPPVGYGGIERICYERGLTLSKKFKTRVDYIAPYGSDISFADNVYFTNIIRIRRQHKSLQCCSNMLEKTYNYLKFVSDTYALTYTKMYIDTLSELNLEKYDVIINDAFRNEIWNFFMFEKMPHSLRMLSILHMNAPFWTKIPNILNSGLIFGALNSQTAIILTNKGYRAYHLPNGIIVPEERKNRDSDDFLIFVGRITPEKGVHLAISIAKSLHKKLLIFGVVHDKEYFGLIKKRIDNKQIFFFENAPRDFLEEKLSQALALVFTSTYPDCYPTVLLEALSYGVPGIALYPPRPSGFYDLYNEKVCIAGKNVNELVSKFNMIYDFDRKYVLEYAMKNLSWEAVIKKKYLPIIIRLFTRND